MNDLKKINRDLATVQKGVVVCCELPGSETPSEEKVTHIAAMTTARAWCGQYLPDESAIDLLGPVLCDCLTLASVNGLKIHYLGPVRLSLFEAIEAVEEGNVNVLLGGIAALSEDFGLPFDFLVEATAEGIHRVLNELKQEIN